jgi:ATPase family associated with various cellular activities (AAA)
VNAPFLHDAPAEALLAAAEAFALARFEAFERGDAAAAPDGFASEPETALARLADGFALGPPETALVALLFAAACSEAVARRVTAAAPESGGRGLPAWLAMRLVPALDLATLAAGAPLRRFGIVAVEPGAVRIEARLSLGDGLVDRFCGAPPAEPDVAARILPLRPDEGLANPALAGQLAAALAARGRDKLSPLVLAGRSEPAVLAASLAALGLVPHGLRTIAIPEDAEARDALARRWSRDAALDRGVLVIQIGEPGPPPAIVADFAERVLGHVVVAGPVSLPCLNRAISAVGETVPAAPAERWRQALGPARSARLGAAVARVGAQFRLDPSEIDAVCARAGTQLDAAPDADAAGRILWHEAGRFTAGTPTPGVAIVEPAYRWDDIVLAASIEAALRRIETHVRHATLVMDDWGFAGRMGGRGRGVAALFSGPSGTGKTMAAEVLASALDLRMMVIDLSQIISKYIGETSKNIAAAFDQAERCGAVMVWNEGDAIWGSRGSVGNATDRHVNAEVGDLLQRIEAFRGFTIVTTNMKHAIDPAFLRRFRFSIDFQMPSETERLRLWQRAFPEAAPVEPINWAALAALPLSGGSIRNIALGSAFLAADRGGRIDRALISAELGEELRKQDQPVRDVDWETGR